MYLAYIYFTKLTHHLMSTNKNSTYIQNYLAEMNFKISFDTKNSVARSDKKGIND